MNIRVTATKAQGKINILSSKSELHRLLILSAFADGKTKIKFAGKPSADVIATIGCIRSIGATVEMTDGLIIVNPIGDNVKNKADVFCAESGSTLRFILPVFSGAGIDFNVTVSGRLGERPLSPMYELLTEHGVNMSENGKYPLSVNGRFTGGNVSIRGDVSSQFISGLLMAMPLTKDGGSVTVTGDFQSRPYVDITVYAMRKFGVTVIENGNTYIVKGKYKSPQTVIAGGDWSNTAFFACMGAISGETLVCGLEEDSMQGDKAIADVLKRFGAEVNIADQTLTVKKKNLIATQIDAKNIPDLVPTLAVVASLAKGETKIFNAQRLRIKESDRIKSVKETIVGLGGEAIETEDGLIIKGKERLNGGRVSSFNDHRIVMSACVAALGCDNPVVIQDAEAVNKSYPQFFEEIKKLGYTVEEI